MRASEPDLELCGEAENKAQSLAQLQNTAPDVTIVDISLKSEMGINLIKRIKTLDSSIKILVQSMCDEKLCGERALRAGAMGYVNKQDPAPTSVTVIHRVLGGKMYFSHDFADHVVQRTMQGNKVKLSTIEALADRALEVFERIGQGLSTGNIVEYLHLGRSTIDTYRDRPKAKLGLESACELVHRATQWVTQNV